MLEECRNKEAVRRVTSGDADLGLVVAGCDVSGLWWRPHRSDPLTAVMCADDPLDGRRLACADLLERDLVGLEGGSTLTRLLTAQAAARSFAHAMRLKLLPLSDAWAMRHMHLVARSEPPVQTPLGTLIAHLETCANSGARDHVGM